MIGLIPTADLLPMPSADAHDYFYELDGQATVADMLPHKRTSEHYPELLDSVRRDGITVPVLLRTDPDGVVWLVEGHHRVTAAVDAGLEVVPWTDVPLEVDQEAMGPFSRRMHAPWGGYRPAPAAV